MVGGARRLEGVLSHGQIVVRLGVHGDKALGVGHAAGIAKSAVAGFDAFAGVGPAIALAPHTVEGGEFLLDNVGNVDENIVVVAAGSIPDVARQRGGACA